MKKKNKTLVALYVRYGLGDVVKSREQEIELRKYCQKKGYRVINIYRDIENLQLYYSDSILSIIVDSICIQYDKLLIVDISQIAKREGQIAAFYELLNNKGIILETLHEGIVGKDILLETTIRKNVRQKSKLQIENNDF